MPEAFISAGKLNRRILILAQSTAQDESGQQINTWKPVLNTRASIHAATGREIYAAAGFTSQLTHVVTIRFNPAITIKSSQRVKYRDRTFDIQAVSDPTEGRRQLDLLCLEIDGGQ